MVKPSKHDMDIFLFFFFNIQIPNAAAIAAAFGGGLPPGISGTNDRCTVLVSNLNPDVWLIYPLFSSFIYWYHLSFILIFFSLFYLCLSTSSFQRIDEDKIFNLFSIYGNIIRIKLLRNKPDHALVQLADGFQAELAVHFLKVDSCHLIEIEILDIVVIKLL